MPGPMRSVVAATAMVSPTDPSNRLEDFLHNHLEPENARKRQLSTGTANKTKNTISRNAARERSRVKSLRNAFLCLQMSLPSVPPNTKLSKLDVLILATSYISHLRRILSQEETLQDGSDCMVPSCVGNDVQFSAVTDDPRSLRWENSYLHPVRKWPMRSRLYAGVEEDTSSSTTATKSSYSMMPVMRSQSA